MGASHFCKYIRRGEAPDGTKYLVLTNKLSAGMLRPYKDSDAPDRNWGNQGIIKANLSLKEVAKQYRIYSDSATKK